MMSEKYNIIILEDDENFSKSLEFALKTHNCSVTTFENGIDALHGIISILSKGAVINLLLVDYHLPLMDGLEFFDKLFVTGYKGPIIFMTALPSKALKKKTKDYSKSIIVEKPLEATVFINDIMNMLDGNAA